MISHNIEINTDLDGISKKLRNITGVLHLTNKVVWARIANDQFAVRLRILNTGSKDATKQIRSIIVRAGSWRHQSCKQTCGNSQHSEPVHVETDDCWSTGTKSTGFSIWKLHQAWTQKFNSHCSFVFTFVKLSIQTTLFKRKPILSFLYQVLEDKEENDWFRLWKGKISWVNLFNCDDCLIE